MEFKPNEIAFLSYLNGLPRANNLPDYWKYSYGVNTEKVAQKFISLGLMEYKKDYKKALLRLYISELKSILKDNSLSISGKKEILVDRILENVDIDFIDSILKEKNFFILTEKGQALIDKYEICVLNVSKNYNFTNNEILSAIELSEAYSTNDRLWSIFNTRNIKFPSQKRWHSYRMNLFNMGELLFSENKYQQALSCYISVFIIDLSGMSESNFVYDIDSISVSTLIIKNIKSLISLSEINIDDVKDIINKDIASNCLPFQYYTKETIFKILYDCLDDIKFNYKNYPYNKPITNSPNYKYFSLDNDDSIESDVLNIKPNNKKNDLSLSKIGLGVCTGGLSLLFTGIHKKEKQDKSKKLKRVFIKYQIKIIGKVVSYQGKVN